MAGPGLFDPIGMDAASPRRTRSAWPMRAIAPALLAAAAVALAGFAWLRDDGDRGQPRATVPIVYAPAPARAPIPSRPAPPPEAPSLPATAAAAVRPAAESAPPVSFAVPSSAAPDAVRPDDDAAVFAREDGDVEVQNGVRVIRPRRDRAAAEARPRAPGDRAAPR